MVEALGEALREAADHQRGEHRPEEAAVAHHHRYLLQEDAVAQQAAADAGDEGEHEGADHVVAALGRRPDAGQREQEYRGEIEPDRQQERDARHAAMVALLAHTFRGRNRVRKTLCALAIAGVLFGLQASAQTPEVTLTRIDCGTGAKPTDVNERFSRHLRVHRA